MSSYRRREIGRAGIQCYQVFSGFRVKPGMTGEGIIQKSPYAFVHNQGYGPHLYQPASMRRHSILHITSALIYMSFIFKSNLIHFLHCWNNGVWWKLEKMSSKRPELIWWSCLRRGAPFMASFTEVHAELLLPFMVRELWSYEKATFLRVL